MIGSMVHQQQQGGVRRKLIEWSPHNNSHFVVGDKDLRLYQITFKVITTHSHTLCNVSPCTLIRFLFPFFTVYVAFIPSPSPADNICVWFKRVISFFFFSSYLHKWCCNKIKKVDTWQGDVMFRLDKRVRLGCLQKEAEAEAEAIK